MKMRSYALKLTTFAVLAMCFSILFGGNLVLKNLDNVLTAWGEDLQMNVYLNSGHSEQQRNELIEKIKQYPHVEKVDYASEEESLKTFQTQMAEYSLDLLKDPEIVNMIPASLGIKFKSDVRGQEQIQLMNLIKQDFKDNPAIEEISFGQDWVQKYTHITDFFAGFMLILGVSIGAASLFVISNIIQNSIRQRRAEIEVLELLGATAAMIRRPFLIEAAKIGFISMLSAVLINGLLFQILTQKFSATLALFKLTNIIQFSDFKSIILFLIMGPLLGILSSYLCLRRINTGWAAAKRI